MINSINILPFNRWHKLIAFAFSCFALNVSAQESSLKKIAPEVRAKITISEFCLCDTRLADLSARLDDLEMVEVEEMDSPKQCYGQDSRYENGSGWTSNKFPGMIFQEGNVEGYIGKIRLTKNFSGKLPNGASIDMNTMKLRDVFTIYPDLKNAWGSRGCSDYWNFSDKTISFYVKIDKTIQPQFPIRESDYLDKPVEGIDIVASCYSLLVPSKDIQLFAQDEPMLFLDSVRTNQRFVSGAVDPDEIAMIVVIKDPEAIQAKGEEAKNGIVYLYTKEFARSNFWNLFRNESPAYAKAVPSADFREVAYILNGKVLTENYEGTLFSLSKENLESIRVLNSKQLKKEFNKKSKVGVVINTKEE